MTLVIDASVALAWCFEDEARPEIDALEVVVRDEGALVPALWHLEVGNILLQAEKRQRLSASEVDLRLQLLSQLPIETDEPASERAWHDILALARKHGLTVYDAAYLELAVRRGAALATLDGDLIKACGSAGIAIKP